jgi:hypothetical protein
MENTMASGIYTTAVNRRGKFFRLEYDTIINFISMLDIDCKPTTNPDDCIIAIFQLPDGLFKGVDL